METAIEWPAGPVRMGRSVWRRCWTWVPGRCWAGVLLGSWLVFSQSTLLAGELKVRAELVWGTDSGQPEGQKFKELDPTVRERFLRHLRWRNYYVVRSMVASVEEKQTERLTLSKRCTVDVHLSGSSEVQIRIHSTKEGEEPKVVKTDKIALERLKAGHALVFGGDSKDNWDDAWFVVVTHAPDGVSAN